MNARYQYCWHQLFINTEKLVFVIGMMITCVGTYICLQWLFRWYFVSRSNDCSNIKTLFQPFVRKAIVRTITYPLCECNRHKLFLKMYCITMLFTWLPFNNRLFQQNHQKTVQMIGRFLPLDRFINWFKCKPKFSNRQTHNRLENKV